MDTREVILDQENKKEVFKENEVKINSNQTTSGQIERINTFLLQKPPVVDNWITLELRMLPWKYMNLTVTVPTKTSIGMIKRRVMEHHNSTISNIIMFKGKVGKENLLNIENERNDLIHYGFTGGPKSEHISAIIYYDFDPFQNGK